MPVAVSPSRSISNNELCGLNEYGDGTYTTEGIIAICEVLKTNSSLRELKYIIPLSSPHNVQSVNTH